MTRSTPMAADFMSSDVETVSPDSTLNEVVQFLLDRQRSNAPVVEESPGGSRLLGFISERDCLAALSTESYFGIPSPPQTARTIMRTHPVCVSPTTEMFELASIFVNHGFRHLPVVDHECLIGIVSRRDVLKAVDEHYTQTTADIAEQRRPPYYQNPSSVTEHPRDA